MAYTSTKTHITTAQIKLVHTLKTKLHWDDDTYRENVIKLTGKESSKELCQADARLLIDFMRADLGEEAPAKVSPASMKPTSKDFLTKSQREYIVNLWWQVCRYRDPQQKRLALRAFVERQTGCSDLRFVPRNKGRALICAIKAMKQQKEAVNG